MSEVNKTPNQSLLELQRIRLALFMLCGTANLFFGAFLVLFRDGAEMTDGAEITAAVGFLFLVIGLAQKAIGVWSWLDLQKYRH